MRIKPIVKMTQNEAITFYEETKPDFGFYSSDYYEMVLPLSGQVEVSYDNKKRVLDEESGIIFSPDVLRRVTVREDEGACLFIRYSAAICKNVFETLGSDTADRFLALPVYNFTVDAQYVNSIRVAIEHAHIASEECKELALKKLAYTAFLRFVPFHEYLAENDVTSRSLAAMNNPEYVGYRLPDIAQKIGCSEEYLVRCFKKSGLETPNTVFKRIKLRYAKSLLLNGTVSVSTVASIVGFRSVGHFNKLYSTEFGVCPGNDKTK